MHFLVLALGLLIGIYALSRFFMNANIQQIKSFILAAITITICAALFILAVTGRLPAAIAIVSALAPFIVAWYTDKKAKKSAYDKQVGDTAMNRKEALKILGLEESAGEDDIKKAYKSLIKKVHPDQKGSEWMASKLNEAKDFLLK
tara:strand:+ start:199 stop:636 length:438 start_codon:yes stop_codon:yes gene_type:complete